MPIDPSYADVGIKYSSRASLVSDISPQVGFNFSTLNGVFTQSNGVRSLDPSTFIDLSSVSPSFTPVTATNGRLGNPSSTSPMGILGPFVSPTGFYFRSQIFYSGVVDLTFLLAHPTGSSGGYQCTISNSQQLKISISKVDAGGVVQEVLKTVDISPPSNASLNDFMFIYDGSRFKAFFNNSSIQTVDDTYTLVEPDFAYAMAVFTGPGSNCVSKLDFGAFDGINLPNESGDPFFDPINSSTRLLPLSGPERGIVSSSLVADKDMLEIVPVSGSSYLAPGEDVVEFSQACDSLGLSKIFSLNSVPSSLSPIPNFPGDLSDETNPNTIRVGIIDPFQDEIANIEDLASKNFGLRGHIITPTVPATPFFTEDDFADIAAIATTDLNNGRIPFFNFIYYDWNDGATPNQFTTDFQFIIDELSGVNGPCWVGIAPSPLAFYDQVEGGGDFNSWVNLQTYFKSLLVASENDNISFVFTAGYYDYFTGSASFMDSIANHPDVWDAMILDIPYSDMAFWESRLDSIRDWCTNTRLKLVVSFKNSGGATPSTDTVQATHNEDLYNYCLGSDDGNGTRIIGLAYNNTGDIGDGGTVLVDDILTGFVSLIGNTESVSKDVGFATRQNFIEMFPGEPFYNDVAQCFVVAVYTPISQAVLGLNLNITTISPWYNISSLNGGITSFNKYESLYQEVSSTIRQISSSIKLCGPDLRLSARSEGYDQNYNGVSVDSRYIDALETFINKVEAATPEYVADAIIFEGGYNWTATNYVNLIGYVKSLTSLPLIVRCNTITGTQDYSPIVDALDVSDQLILPFGGVYVGNLTSYESSGWKFSCSLVLPSPGALDSVISLTYSENILGNGTIYISDNDEYSESFDILKSGLDIKVGNLNPGTYSIDIIGDVLEAGSATLRLAFDADNISEKSVSDTKFFGG